MIVVDGKSNTSCFTSSGPAWRETMDRLAVNRWPSLREIRMPLLARTLGVTVEALIGEKSPPARRGPTPKLQQQVERLSRLPQAKQRVVVEMLEGFLDQAARTG